MDRAYSYCKERQSDKRKYYTDPVGLKQIEHGYNFVAGMNSIIDYMKNKKYMTGCTWFINEATFDTTILYPDIIETLYNLYKKYNCEIGLHTHFESNNFKYKKDGLSDEKKIAEKSYWFEDGLVKPKKRIEDFIYNKFNEHYNIDCFKAGGHMRNRETIESLMETNFKIDCTCLYEQKRIIEANNRIYKIYDDTNIKLEDGPFLIKNNNKTLLEIPECQNYNVFRRSMKKMRKNNQEKDIYLLLQVHPYQCVNALAEKNLLNWIDKYISIVKEFYDNDDIVICNMKKMGEHIIENNNYYEMSIDEFIKL